MLESCKTCKYFKADGDNYGTCHKRSPEPGVNPNNPDSLVAWPLVELGEWCGDYKEKTKSRPLQLLEAAVKAERDRCIHLTMNIDPEMMWPTDDVASADWPATQAKLLDLLRNPD